MSTTQPASTFGYFQPSPIPDVATAETIRFMCGVIDGAAKNPAIKQAARDAVERFGPLGSYDPSGVTYDPQSAGYKARAVFWFARYMIERLHHDEFKAMVAAFPDKKQLLVSPDDTTLMLLSSHPQGDCSAFTMAICALLRCLGVNYELVAIAQTDVFNHVYPRA